MITLTQTYGKKERDPLAEGKDPNYDPFETTYGQQFCEGKRTAMAHQISQEAKLRLEARGSLDQP